MAGKMDRQYHPKLLSRWPRETVLQSRKNQDTHTEVHVVTHWLIQEVWGVVSWMSGALFSCCPFKNRTCSQWSPWWMFSWRKEHWRVETTCLWKLEFAPLGVSWLMKTYLELFTQENSAFMTSHQKFKIWIMDFVLRNKISLRNLVWEQKLLPRMFSCILQWSSLTT